MKVEDLTASAQDAITVKKVFSEPLERDGLTLITAARVRGGAGGGGGHDQGGQEGEGGGFGMAAHPAGAYVLRGDKVTWRPAVDVNRLAMTVGAVLITFLITRMRSQRARMRAQIIRTATEEVAERTRRLGRRRHKD